MKALKTIPTFYMTIILILCSEKMLWSQSCLEEGVIFSSQEQIDSFPIAYPGCSEIGGSVDIKSDSGLITNLLGLSALTSINGDLRIFQNPVLKELAGLNNLHTVSGFFYIGDNDSLSDLTALMGLINIGHTVSIANNASLESLSGLDNIEFELFDYLEIFDNPHLTHCSVASVCQHLSRYGAFKIYKNGPGCNFVEEIYSSCPYGPDSLAQYEELCLEDGFESWLISNDSIVPGQWTIEPVGLWISEGKLNVERVASLNEGDYALLMRSNGPGFEGPERTSIERKICGLPSRVDIAFTYTCRGEGNCQLMLGQAKDTVGGVNWRPIWSGYTWDTIRRTVVLNNIPVNPPFTGFQRIRFRTNPVYWTGGSYGISEFTIDSLVMKEYSIVTSDHTLTESPTLFTIYPNPSHDLFYIKSSKSENPDLITTYSMDGQVLLQVYDDWRVDLSPFPAGMYVVETRFKDQIARSRIIKL